MKCTQCDSVYINGVYCHETGCPLAWRDQIRECEECGCEFKPEGKEQRYCDSECFAAAMGEPLDDVESI